jgi:hypothetical protein
MRFVTSSGTRSAPLLNVDSQSLEYGTPSCGGWLLLLLFCRIVCYSAEADSGVSLHCARYGFQSGQRVYENPQIASALYELARLQGSAHASNVGTRLRPQQTNGIQFWGGKFQLK